MHKNVSRYCNKDSKVMTVKKILVTFCQLWKWFCLLRKLWKPPSRSKCQKFPRKISVVEFRYNQRAESNEQRAKRSASELISCYIIFLVPPFCMLLVLMCSSKELLHLKMEWASFGKSLFWKTNDSIANLTISFTGGLSLWDRPCH